MSKGRRSVSAYVSRFWRSDLGGSCQRCAIGNMESMHWQPVGSDTECSVSLEIRWRSKVLICCYTFFISRKDLDVHSPVFVPDFCENERVEKCSKLSEKITGVCSLDRRFVLRSCSFLNRCLVVWKDLGYYLSLFHYWRVFLLAFHWTSIFYSSFVDFLLWLNIYFFFFLVDRTVSGECEGGWQWKKTVLSY